MYVAKQIKILFFINERAFMLNHYRGTGGYAALYLMIVFGVILLTTVLAVIMSVVGLGQNAGKIAGGIIFIALWAIGFVVMQRFIAIEKRRPTLGESNIVGVKSVLYFLAITLVVVLVIAVTVLLTKLIGGGGVLYALILESLRTLFRALAVGWLAAFIRALAISLRRFWPV